MKNNNLITNNNLVFGILLSHIFFCTGSCPRSGKSITSGASTSFAFIDAGTSSPGYNTAGANYAGKGIIYFQVLDLTAVTQWCPF